MVDNNSIQYRDRKALTGNTYAPVLLSILCQFIFSYILPTCTVLHLALSREQEKEAVVFAKEVRKANKLLTRLEEEASAQPSKLFAR
jgi:hypothetical protein